MKKLILTALVALSFGGLRAVQENITIKEKKDAWFDGNDKYNPGLRFYDEQKELLGQINYLIKDDILWIETLAVNKFMRNEGVSKRILPKFIEWLIKKYPSVSEIKWQVVALSPPEGETEASTTKRLGNYYKQLGAKIFQKRDSLYGEYNLVTAGYKHLNYVTDSSGNVELLSRL